MSRHDAIVQPGSFGRLGVDVLLDQCRRLAGARITGALQPADAALSALRTVLPLDAAYHLFGLLHDLTATAMAMTNGAFLWHPAGARWRSADEEWLVAHALAPLALGAEPRAAIPAEEIDAGWCADAQQPCGLRVIEGEACGGRCPFAARSPCETGCSETVPADLSVARDHARERLARR